MFNSYHSDHFPRASLSLPTGSPLSKEKSQADKNLKVLPSISQDTEEIDDHLEEEKIPSDPLDLVDLKVKHSVAKDSEHAKISSIVEKFCKFSSSS